MPSTLLTISIPRSFICITSSEIGDCRPCINTRTDNFHFSRGFDPDTGNPVEFFITGCGKVGQDLDTELYELSVKASKLMQGE